MSSNPSDRKYSHQQDLDTQSFLSGSSIFSFIKDERLRFELIKRSKIKSVQAGEVVFLEGSSAEVIFIPLQGTVIDLFSGNQQSEPVHYGSVLAGRVANFYSVIRHLPFQYSAQCREDGRVLEIPWEILKDELGKTPGVVEYLILATEYPIIRKLAKEMDDLGIDKIFKASLLGSSSVTKLLPQQVVATQDQPFTFAFVPLESSLNASRKKKGSNLSAVWPLPEATWFGLKELAESELSAATIRTSSSAQVLQLRPDSLQTLKENFPEDFSKYIDFVEATHSNEEDEEEERHEEIDVEEVFADAGSAKRKSFLFRYPFVAQNDMMDCAPACLSMISSYHGNDLPIQFWRQRLYTNQEGTNLFDLSSTAEKNGFRTAPIGIETVDDLDAGMLPAIVLRKYHYMVLYEVREKHVIVGDPGCGVVKMSKADFHEGFEKAALLLAPTPEFNQLDAPRSKYAHFIGLTATFKKEMAIVMAASLAMICLSLMMPFLLQVIFDRVLPAKDETLLNLVLVAALCFSIAEAVIGYVRSYYLIYISSKFEFIAMSSFFKKLLSLPFEFISTRHTGDFTRRLNEMERLREFLTMNVIRILLDLLSMTVFAIALFSFSPFILGVTLSLCVVIVGSSMAFSERLLRIYNENFPSLAEQETLVSDTLKGIPTIKTLSCEITARWRIEERLVKNLIGRKRFQMTAGVMSSVSGLIDQVANLVIVGLGAWLALREQLTPGQVVSVSVLVRGVISPFTSLAFSWAGIQETKAIANRLNDVFLAESESSKRGKRSDKLVKKRLQGEIEFQSVWFRYGGESSNWALKNVSFKIEAGRAAALVGPSGSGKSTVGQLLGGLYYPTRGRILIDGRDMQDYDMNWLRKRMGFILQEPSLFSGTIAENIAISDSSPDFARVEEVALRANADGFINAKPNGYQYFISHGGLGLSGGEKQRIAFARALYGDPDILVLDEATSAMDGISEKAILETLKGGRRTMVNIAHRFSTAIASDFVILLDKGEVVSLGSHEYLALKSPLYSQLFNLDQISGSNPKDAKFKRKTG